MEATPKVWVVRGGNYNELASQVKLKGAVAVGWKLGDASAVHTRDQMRAALEEAEPGGATPNAVGQMYRFAREIGIGDYVLTPEQATATIHLTRCSGPYKYDPTVFAADYPHVRPVDYLHKVPRAHFPQVVRNTLGSTLTVFRADIALPYVQQALGQAPNVGATPPDPPEPGVWADEIEGQARGQILEALDEIDHHQFQVFVAGLLAAMNYKTVVGGKGSDGGVDVLAYPDAFGLASPRIKVQVKNQRTTAGIQDVGYLNGVISNDERGLFVCTGGFTKDAQNAAFVKNGHVALVDGGTLVDLLLEHYEQMPDRAKQLLPLRRLYVPEKPASV